MDVRRDEETRKGSEDEEGNEKDGELTGKM